MKRISALLSTWKTNWADDPAARGAAKMTAGAALVLEGLFGVRARVRGKSGGILVALFLIPFGAIFFGIGHLIKPKPFADEVAVQGTIISSQSHMSQDSDGRNQRMYKATYGYEVDGKSYRLQSSISSSSVPKQGKRVKLAYSASNPSEARRTDGMDGNFHLIFQGVGALVALIGLYQMMICMLLLVAGAVLFSAGRKDRMSSGTTNGFFKDLFSLVRAQRNDQDAALAGGAGVVSMLQRGFGNTGGSFPETETREAEASLPPAGWMLDPENSAQMRWWDGKAWTDMRKPVESERPDSTDTQGW